jgi:hypothetical protein
MLSVVSTHIGPNLAKLKNGIVNLLTLFLNS